MSDKPKPRRRRMDTRPDEAPAIAPSVVTALRAELADVKAQLASTRAELEEARLIHARAVKALRR